MARKTVTVDWLKSQLNHRIKNAPTLTERMALCLVLESILHEVGNYRGFSYLDGWTGTEDWRHWYN